MTSSSTDHAEFEAKLIALFQAAPEGSLAWECYQHAQFSWDNGVADWVQAVVDARCFAELYGMGDAEIDAEALIREPNSHCDALISLLREHWHHVEAPDLNMPQFWTALYWFGLKMTVLDIIEQARGHST